MPVWCWVLSSSSVTCDGDRTSCFGPMNSLVICKPHVWHCTVCVFIFIILYKNHFLSEDVILTQIYLLQITCYSHKLTR